MTVQFLLLRCWLPAFSVYTLLQLFITLSSAGVGRTGTYIALDYLLDQAAKENVVDMFECTKEMRSRRPCMIQTEVGLKTCNNDGK